MAALGQIELFMGQKNVFEMRSYKYFGQELPKDPSRCDWGQCEEHVQILCR